MHWSRYLFTAVEQWLRPTLKPKSWNETSSLFSLCLTKYTMLDIIKLNICIGIWVYMTVFSPFDKAWILMDTENISYILDGPLIDTLKDIIGRKNSKKKLSYYLLSIILNNHFSDSLHNREDIWWWLLSQWADDCL